MTQTIEQIIEARYINGVDRQQMKGARPIPEPVIEIAEKLAAYLIDEDKLESAERLRAGYLVEIPAHVVINDFPDDGDSIIRWVDPQLTMWRLTVTHDGRLRGSEMFGRKCWIPAFEVQERFEATL